MSKEQDDNQRITDLPISRNSEANLIWAGQLVSAACAKKFWGKLVLHFEDGKIVRAQTERTLKPPDSFG